jgi:hypothetical protein
MEYIEIDDICDDCVMAIANDDYSGISEEQELAIRDSLARIGKWLIVGDDRGFEHTLCAVCRAYPGNRHQCGYME